MLIRFPERGVKNAVIFVRSDEVRMASPEAQVENRRFPIPGNGNFYDPVLVELSGALNLPADNSRMKERLETLMASLDPRRRSDRVKPDKRMLQTDA